LELIVGAIEQAQLRNRDKAMSGSFACEFNTTKCHLHLELQAFINSKQTNLSFSG